MPETTSLASCTLHTQPPLTLSAQQSYVKASVLKLCSVHILIGLPVQWQMPSWAGNILRWAKSRMVLNFRVCRRQSEQM